MSHEELTRCAAEMFSKLSPELQDAVLELTRSLVIANRKAVAKNG